MKTNKRGLIIIGIATFCLVVSMVVFVINACMDQNIPLAWVLTVIIGLSIISEIVGFVIFVVDNKKILSERFKDLK